MKAAKVADVDAYIAGAAPAARPILEEVRTLITAAVPGAEERISYGVPFYKYHGELAGFSVYTQHVSFGFSSGVLDDDDRELLEAKGYKTGKRTVQIAFDQKVPTTVLRRLLKAQARRNKDRDTK